MCVIMCSATNKPTEAMMQAGHEKNPWGAGVAWQEKDKKGKTWMRWEKGITDIGETVKLVKELPEGPIVVHFRIPTEGMNDISLTHPFPVTPEAELKFSGKTEAKLLFHNGGWGNWRNFSLETAQKAGRRLPSDGMLSDSRMMAWNVDFYGSGLLYLINEKVILFGPDGIEIFGPKDEHMGWSYDTETKVWASNGYWKSCLPRTQVATTTHSRTTDGTTGGGRPQAGFRPDRQLGSGSEIVGGGRTEPQQVEGREAHIQTRTEQDRKVVGAGGKPAIRRPLTADPLFKSEVSKLGEINPHEWAGLTRRAIVHRAGEVVM